jgi:predicted metal-dependent phosphoesterase TrpH
MIDLHMHSTYSDGSKTPEELILEAKQTGLSAIALTDHDTIDGVPEFLELGEKHGITAVPGVEISVDSKLPNNGHIHILGLLIDPYSSELKETLNYLLTQRNLRAQRIIRKLTDLDIDISMQELLDEAGEGAIGRPHVARILVRKGVVTSIQEAFDIYLAKGKPAYMDKEKLGEIEALKMIRDAGGLAILAHAHLMNYDSFEEAREKILTLKELGLDGFEVYYSGMPREYSENLLRLAEEHHFLISGGSDYHGANKDSVRMGSGKNNDLNIPDKVLVQLQEGIARKNQLKKIKG